MKKKLLSVILSVAMVASLLVGCGGKTETTTESTATESTAATEKSESTEETAPAASGEVQ